MIKKLEWDSIFFQKNIASLDCSKDITIEVVDRFIQAEKIDLIQAQCEIENIQTINYLENNGYIYKDMQVVLSNRNIKEPRKKLSQNIVKASVNDLDLIKVFLHDLYRFSRYNFFFSKDIVFEFYLTWIEKAILGSFDDICFIYKDDNKVSGFITLRYAEDKSSADIGLLGVDPTCGGKGVGSSLLDFVKELLCAQNIKSITTRTQGRNIAAQNFYHLNGFIVEQVFLWLYKKI